MIDYPGALISMPLGPIVFGSALGGPALSFAEGHNLFSQVRLDELSVADEAVLRGLQGTAPGNSFVLATLNFRADAVGSAEFDFNSALLTLNGLLVTADLIGATVEIDGTTQPPQVPEPGTWTAMVSGLGGLWLWRRKRASQLRAEREYMSLPCRGVGQSFGQAAPVIFGTARGCAKIPAKTDIGT